MPRRSSPRPAAPRRDSARPPPSPPGAPAAREHRRDLVAVCGLAAVEALFAAAPERVERLFYEPQFAAALAAARQVLAGARKPYREVGPDELARIAETVRHGGVVAVAQPRPVPRLDAALASAWQRDGRPVLILDGIGNPHNLGAIIRSAAFFRVERIVLADRPEQARPSAASYRVAEGALDRVSLCRAAVPVDFDMLRPGFRIVGSALDRGTPLRRFRSDRPVALVLGNEERGLDKATLAACDAVVTIPGSGLVQSLNVAAAAAVLLYALASR